jgi:hypothetical protein
MLYRVFIPALVHRILSNCYIDLSDFSSAALSSIAVATATPHSSALQLKKSSCVNIDVLEKAIRLPGESLAYMIVLNSQRGESIDIVCICRMLRDT